MPTRAPDKNTISINGKLYRTRGKVRQFLASQQPGKITIGDYDEKSNPYASEFSLDDFRDGIGVEIGELPRDQHRVWWSTAQLRYKGRVILPRLATQTAAGPAAEVQELITFKDEVYATYGTSVRVYNNSTDSWGSSLRTLAGNATDAAVGLLSGTETLVIANGTDVDYATDSSTWAENTGQAIKYVVFWKDLLWGITNTGQLYYTDDLTETWSADALLQLPSGSVTGLLVARGPDREEHIYAVTNQGLFVHDDRNARFLPTDLALPVHPNGGKGNEVWRGSIYTSAGNAIYKFQAGADQTSVGVVGPDQDHGLPSDRRGVISRLVGSHNDLLAVLDASTAAGVSGLTTRVSRGVRFHHGVTFPASTGYSHILGWNERGWEVKWLSGASSRAISAAVVSNAYSQYRLWWAVNQRVYWMQLPVDVVNPLQVSSSTYGDSATLETPWFDMGIRNQRKLALSVIVETVNPSDDETVTVEYATDYTETYTEVGVQDTTGEVEYLLPEAINPEGVPFRAWKFRVTFARGSTTTSTPQLVKLTLVWRPRIDVLYGIAADLDLTEPVGSRAVSQQLLDLKAALTSHTLVEVTFKDDASGDQNYLMDILNLESIEQTGKEPHGYVRVTMAEPRHTNEHEDR